MPDLFISHSTKDDSHADGVAALLAEEGVSCWIDHQGGLTPGTPNWDSGIRAAIKDCRAGLLIMSPRSLASEICAAECLLLRDLGKPLYVAYLETCAPTDIWLYIKMIQYADLRMDVKKGAAAIVRALRGDGAPDTPTPVRGRITGGDTMRVYLPYLNSVPLTGRDADVTGLRAMLGAHVTQLTALGGTGKSRIAAEIALSAANGAIWHRCDSTSAPFSVIDLIRQHYGLDEKASDDLVIAALDSVPPLIVIDNAEDIVAGTDRRTAYVALFNRLVAHGAPLLLTSRVVWHELKPRKDYPLQPISLDQAEKLALDFASVEEIALSSADARSLADAARLHPRLIEFSIRQLHERDVRTVLRQLRELKHADVQDALDEMIHRTVRQMRETAKGGERAESLLQRLTVFRGAFGRDAVRALKPTTLSEDEVDDALVLLARWKFVRKDGERYRVEDMVSGALLADVNASSVHFEYYFGLYGDHNTNNDEDYHPKIGADWVDIRAALLWGRAQRAEEMVEWVHALQYYMQLRISRSEWRELTQTAYETAVRQTNQRGAANTLRSLGDVALQLNEYEQARAYYGQALVFGEQIGDFTVRLNTLANLARLEKSLDNHTAACDYYRRTLDLAESHPFFKTHPVVEGWRRAYAELECESAD